MSDPDSHLHHTAQKAMDQQTVNTGGAVSGEIIAFPILSGSKSVGALLCVGTRIPRDDYPLWQFLLKPFGHRISLQHDWIHSHFSGTIHELKCIAIEFEHNPQTLMPSN